jgi:hypothetical protein
MLFAAMFVSGLFSAGTARGQQDPLAKPVDSAGTSKSTPSALEQMLEKALKQNPDILVAEAKVHETQAELNRVRQHVMAKMVVLNTEVEALTNIVKEAKIRFDRTMELHEKGAVSNEAMNAAQGALLKHKADLAVKEAELQALIGKKTAALSLRVPMHEETTIQPFARLDVDSIKPSTAEQMRIALNTGIVVKWSGAQLEDVLRALQAKIKVVNLFLAPNVTKQGGITLSLPEPITLLAALQLLEDTQGVRFVIREYGIVGMDRNNMPPDVIPVSEFAKHQSEKKPH